MTQRRTQTCFLLLLLLVLSTDAYVPAKQSWFGQGNPWTKPLRIHEAEAPNSQSMRPLVLYARSDSDSDTPEPLTAMMPLLPLISVVFPGLLQLAKSFPANSSEQFAAITALFVSSRLYIYGMSSTIVGLAAVRGARDSPQLGGRIVDLTEELLYRPQLDVSTSMQSGTDLSDETERPTIIQSLSSSGVEESLNDVSGETQALILPLLVSFLLALSVFLVPFFKDTVPTGSEIEAASDLRSLLQSIAPPLSQGWNMLLLVLFTRAEIRRSSFELSLETSATIEWAMAIGITGLASIAKIWQAQNFVNMALAILVARAIQLDQFSAVVGALTLLTIYDATSVFLIPAAGALEASTMGIESSISSDITTSLPASFLAADPTPAASAMGSVAVQKLSSSTFQPGLLITKVGDRLGGSLGLGDAVFPSLLSSFVKRFDNKRESESRNKRISLFAVSMVGYLLGCFACEFAPFLSTSGLPALLFIIPSMVLSVLLAASISGELEDLFEFDPKQAIDH